MVCQASPTETFADFENLTGRGLPPLPKFYSTLTRTEYKPMNDARTDYFRAMLGRLRDKWNVNTVSLILIICTFAIGGSLSGYAGRKILALTGLEHGAWWVLAYVLLITLLWPLAVLLVSIPLGQFRFFRTYLRRLGAKLGLGRKDI